MDINAEFDSRINLEFYKGEDNYSDGEIEEEIVQYIRKTGGKASLLEDILAQDTRWPIIYHLSHIRKNIVNWYPFKKDAKILEVGAGMGAITGTLCERASHVTAIELSKRRATAIALRTQDKNNLNIIVGNLNDINIEEKYDYVTLIGVLEYAASFTEGEDPYSDFLKKISGFLAEDGKILISIENRMGIKYWSGAREDHTGIEYDGITGYLNNKGVETFGKTELENLLQNVGLVHNRFYYPLPDYKLPQIIFSDDYLPTINNSKKYRPFYSSATTLNFSEHSVIDNVIKNNMFADMSNSFFVEASFYKEDLQDAVTFVSFNNDRQSNFRAHTRIVGNSYVEKFGEHVVNSHLKNIASNNKELKNLNIPMLNEEYVEGVLRSEFQKNSSLDEVIVKMIFNNKISDAIKLIEKFRMFLINQSLSEVSIPKRFIKEEKSLFTHYMDGWIDMIFSNCFYDESKFYFYDQEWKFDIVPIEFILYRGIVQLYRFNHEIEKKLALEEMLKKFNIEAESILIFESLEKELMNHILNYDIVTYLENQSEYIGSNEQELHFQSQINNICIGYESEIDRLHLEIENKITEKEEQIKSIVDGYEEEIKRLHKEMAIRLEEKEEQIQNIISDYENEIQRLKNEHNSGIQELENKHIKEIHNLKKDNVFIPRFWKR
ncbi:methyltransferase [Paenibacillus polysaccharolyticus]|uniref:methyltransferase n=1 Tax=Paenibacillus polysaccharolyticus TaxID=582692 RepID=UPI00280B151D|nr:methyltransferase [Paenibacillus polysaccharolyticus]